MAGVATYPQEPVFQTSASEVVLEFPLHILWQCLTLSRQMVGKRRIMLFDDPIEKGLLRRMALVAVYTKTRPGGYVAKDIAFRMFDSAQMAFALGLPVAINVDDTKKLDGLCYGKRIDVGPAP